MEFIKKYIFITVLILGYLIVMVFTLDFGIPNPAHPFTYHMDEWHQLMSVRSLFSQGTSNVLGAANGPIFFFLTAGLFLGPFYVLGLVDPLAIKSSLSALGEQQRLFEVLRLVSVMYGIGSIILVWQIARRYLKINPYITTAFFVLNPIWIMLGNYFKYDIALVFWILISLFCLFWFREKPSVKRYLIFGTAIGLSLATKISSMPLIPVFVLSYLLFVPNKKRKLVEIVYGVLAIGITFFIIGIPDSIFHAKAYYDFFYLNIVSGPGETGNYVLATPVWIFLLSHVYPLTFGHAFYSLFLISLGYFCYVLFYKKKKMEKQLLVLFITLIFFILSLVSLKIQAIGNRVIVLLPFMAFFVGIFYEKLMEKRKQLFKSVILAVFIIGILIQVFEVSAWLQMKLGPNPRHTASVWMIQSLPKHTIGLENIPIYQQIPDIALKEFYELQENPRTKSNFTYEVIDANTRKLPKTMIITNDMFESEFLKDSPKNRLLQRLHKEKYKKIKEFTPSWSLYQQYASPVDMPFLGLVPLMPISIYQK